MRLPSSDCSFDSGCFASSLCFSDCRGGRGERKVEGELKAGKGEDVVGAEAAGRQKLPRELWAADVFRAGFPRQTCRNFTIALVA